MKPIFKVGDRAKQVRNVHTGESIFVTIKGVVTHPTKGTLYRHMHDKSRRKKAMLCSEKDLEQLKGGKMGTIVAEYQSKTKKGRVYSVQVGGDGVTYCDCWQWKINKTCKHTKDYLANEGKRDVAQAPEPVKPQKEVDPVQEAINDIVSTAKGNQ